MDISIILLIFAVENNELRLMNTKNEWKNLLKIYNSELKQYGVSLEITNDGGLYGCNILKDGKNVETYAENFFVYELDELITEVGVYAKNKFGKSKHRNEFKVKGYLIYNKSNPNIVDCKVDSFNKKDFRPQKDWEEVEIIIRRKS